MEEAEKVYSQMQAEFPASDFTSSAGSYFEAGSSELAKSSNDEESIVSVDSDIPKTYNLGNNYPNPFNPSTTIRYALPKSSSIQFVIYNLLGQRIRSYNLQEQTAGYHTLVWNGLNGQGAAAPGGVYILRFNAESLQGDGEVYQKSIKMLLLR